ncbi:MAG: hypothetical protein A4E56_01892 [Pelotomaculum sp. PtaU1.Bin065]|nr:MAG: hypothetical protein A4E56_01892 [Pelotomaculum sp. PtaU1.Bin065]
MQEKTLVILDPTLKKGFTAIPNSVLLANGLSMSAKCLYFILLSFAWQENECFPGQQRLAEAAGCTDRTIRKYLDELREFGLISWVQRGLNQTNIYYIHNLEDLKALSDKDRKGSSVQDRKELSDKEYSDQYIVVVEETPAEDDVNNCKPVVVDTKHDYECQDITTPDKSNVPTDESATKLQEEIAHITGGATISKSFAAEVIKGYPSTLVKTALQDMGDQLARGMIFISGVGAWLRTWLERNYEPDQKPPESVRKTKTKSKKPVKTGKESVSTFGTKEQEKARKAKKKAFLRELYV